MSDLNSLKVAMEKLLSEHGEYYPHYLEQKFPHILQRVIAHWGSLDMEAYLDSLLAPPRAGAKGFPQEAIFEIIAIKAVHRASAQSQCPEQSMEPTPAADMDVTPEAAQTSLPVPSKLSEDEEHNAAMIFDRIQRW